jgi:hypothetical protein
MIGVMETLNSVPAGRLGRVRPAASKEALSFSRIGRLTHKTGMQKNKRPPGRVAS